jgi:AraC family transcriptional regulator
VRVSRADMSIYSGYSKSKAVVSRQMHMSMQHYGAKGFGAVIKKRQVADSILSEYSYQPEIKLPRHSHCLPYFNLILEGAYEEIHGGKVRECKMAMLFFHPEGEVHANRFLTNRTRVFRFEIGIRWLERAQQYGVALNCPLALSSGGAVWLASRLYRELYATDAASALMVEGLLLEIVAEASRYKPAGEGRTPPRWLKGAKELIHAKFSEPISVNNLAEILSVHPIHLSREFRRYYGQSIGEYVRHLRIEFACRELAEKPTPLLEIAAAAGFADQAHLTRTFKRITGLTPRQYRTNFRAR